ncbi:unnamed protein product [Symbiodinium microadriaticum]|nr:unnamed protein product [Symbiodinium microadriaticum]
MNPMELICGPHVTEDSDPKVEAAKAANKLLNVNRQEAQIGPRSAFTTGTAEKRHGGWLGKKSGLNDRLASSGPVFLVIGDVHPVGRPHWEKRHPNQMRESEILAHRPESERGSPPEHPHLKKAKDEELLKAKQVSLKASAESVRAKLEYSGEPGAVPLAYPGPEQVLSAARVWRNNGGVAKLVLPHLSVKGAPLALAEEAEDDNKMSPECIIRMTADGTKRSTQHITMFSRWMYKGNSTTDQKFPFGMNEEELKDTMINFTRRFYLRACERERPPWNPAWFPGIDLSENIMITSSGSLHPWPLQYSKMMSYFHNDSRWHRDLDEGLRRQNMMLLLYPDEKLS